MNILQLNWVLKPGGQDRHVVDLANCLVARGHQVIVGSQGGSWVEQLNCPHLTLPFSDCWPSPIAKLLTSRGIKGLYSVLTALQRTLNGKQIHIVHCHGVPEVVFTSWVRKATTSLVHTHHGCSEGDWSWHVRNVVGRCDRYVGVSEFTSRRLIESGCPPQKVATINYGIAYPHDSPRNVRDAAELRANWIGSKKAKVVVTVARLHHQKGLDILIRAIPLLLKHVSNVYFVVVGGGPEFAGLTSLIESNRVKQCIRLVGHQENVVPYLLAADLFCLPSRWEGLPLSIAEAYRAGLPVVASAVAGTPEIVQEGVTGWLVRSEADADLARVLGRALSNEQLLFAMKQNAREYGHSMRFDPDFVHSQIERLYVELHMSKANASHELHRK